MVNKTLISNFSKIIGNIEIAIHLDSYRNVREDYKMISEKLIQWIKYYYSNKNFEIITSEESFRIHELLEEIKCKIITNNDIGDESMLTDDILIRYEVIIKTINNGRMSENWKR